MDEVYNLPGNWGGDWEKLDIPVFSKEEAAVKAERKNLADVRRGEYEGLKESIKQLERCRILGHPDANLQGRSHSSRGGLQLWHITST